MRRLLGLVLVAGCAKDVTQDLEDLAGRACACADKQDAACGKAVLADMVKLGETKNVKGDERKVAESARRLGDCLLKAGVTSQEISDAVRPRQKPAEEGGGSAAPTPTPTPEPTPGSGSAEPSGSGDGSAAAGSGSGAGSGSAH